MRIIDYTAIHGTESLDGFIAISGLDRNRPSTPQFINLAKLNIELTRPTAFLYIDGVSFTPSDAGIGTSAIDPSVAVIKTTSSYCAHSWVRTFKNKEHLVKVDTISGTCAAGIQALYEADILLNSALVEEVVIIGCERISEATLKLFKELMIPVTCGDGFVFMRLEKGKGIKDVKWKYQFSNNPFQFSRETINSLKPDYPVD